MRDGQTSSGLKGYAVALTAVMGIVLASCATAPGGAVGTGSTQAPAAAATEAAGIVPATTVATQNAPSAATTAPSNAPDTPGQIRLVLASGGNQAKYVVREQLAELSFPSDAIGTTNAVSGAIVLDQNGSVARDQSKFTVDLRTLQSDRRQRDNFIQRNTLETSQFPSADFTPAAVQGLPTPLPTSGAVKFQLTGDLTIHGVTRPATWDVSAQVNGNDLTGTATTSFKFEDFGMQVPTVMVVLSVEDNIKLEYDFHLALAGGGS